MIEDWIWEDNARPLIETLAELAGDDLTKEEWEILRHGILTSDHEANPPIWCKHRFDGSAQIHLQVAKDIGTGVLMLRVSVPPELMDKATFAIDLMGRYIFQKDHKRAE